MLGHTVYKYRLNQLEDRIPYELNTVISEQSWAYLVKRVRERQQVAKTMGVLYMLLSIMGVVTIPISCWSAFSF